MFGLYCLLKDPALFNAQIDIDPSLWWNDGALVAALGAFLKKNPDVVNTLVISETREMERENGTHFAKPVLGAVYELSEEMIDGFGREKMKLERYDDAVAAFMENTKLFSDSAAAFYRLGEAYFRIEKLPESLLNLEKAVELGTRRHDPELRTYISNRNTVRDLLGKK